MRRTVAPVGPRKPPNGGEMALQELTRRKPLLANRTAPEVEALIVELSLELPAYGQVRVADEVRKRGHSISPAGVRGVWQRHDLETMKKRLRALEAKVAQEGIVLTEAQLAALEKAKADKEAHGEFESECPGHGRGAGHVLRRHDEGRGTRLPADLRGHLLQGGLRQTRECQELCVLGTGPFPRDRPQPPSGLKRSSNMMAN